MSDALNYLVKARPEAMSAYFTFLKHAGTKLDPKTRNLISVITKVHSQTEGGLKQYLKRALREGATGPEVIDALLMAFPALGLAKIVWATDIILKMNLPEFSLDAIDGDSPKAMPETWHDIGSTRAIKVGDTARLDCDGRSVFVHRTKKEFRVYDSLCPHQTTNIPHLALKGTTLTCPKHKWQFDITTGACTAEGDTPLKRFESKTERGRLLAFW
jgi:nitrite reductase/ring-hydroxylating ferredoxin subunit/alkylhydroperoxidase/carboxymuconolactone decarboxylase family protein YurZ